MSAALAAEGRPRDGRCAGLGRRRRRHGRHAHLHGRRPRCGLRQGRPILEKMGKNIVHAGASGNGQAAKICNNMILGISMIARQRRLHAGASGWASMRRSCSTSCRRRRAVLVADQLLPGAGPGADLARQPRLPGGLHRRDDAEGPDAGAAGGARGRAPARRWAPRRRSSSACSSMPATPPRISRASSRCWTESELP